MSEKRFVCIDIGYGDEWYITDKEERLSEMEIVDLLNKQQTTISQLKQENKKLKKQLNKQNTMNTQLKEINNEIDDDLYNCRLNKNIISKILKLWQSTLAEYDIYTIKDFKESFELDAKINKEKNEKIKELEEEVKSLNAFIVHEGFAEEYIRWKREGEQFEENIYTPSKKPMRFIGGKQLFKREYL